MLIQHPAVLEAAVVGLPDDVAGELPLAYVVKKPGAKVTAKELEDFVAGNYDFLVLLPTCHPNKAPLVDFLGFSTNLRRSPHHHI